MTAVQPLWRKVLLILVGIVMAVLILGEGLGRWGYERGVGGLLEATGSQDADVYSREAQRYFARARYDAAAQYARTALARAPLHQKAMRTLGLAQVALGQQDAGRRTVQAAGRLGWHDVATQTWLMWDAIQRGDVRYAILRADALARRGTMTPGLFRVLAGFATDPRTRPLLLERLAAGSGWRSDFFQYASAATVSEAKTSESLLRELAGGSARPTRAEVAPVVRRLAALGDYEGAARLASDFLGMPRRGEAVGDGQFRSFDVYGQRPVHRTPFEWDFGSTAGATAVVERPDDPEDGALYVESSGTRRDVVLASKTIGAPAGQRQLTFTVRSADEKPLVRFQWEVTCLSDGRQLIETQPDVVASMDEPQQREARFNVPPGCDFQQLRLVSRAAAQRSSVSAYFDDVAIK